MALSRERRHSSIGVERCLLPGSQLDLLVGLLLWSLPKYEGHLEGWALHVSTEPATKFGHYLI